MRTVDISTVRIIILSRKYILRCQSLCKHKFLMKAIPISLLTVSTLIGMYSMYEVDEIVAFDGKYNQFDIGIFVISYKKRKRIF